MPLPRTDCEVVAYPINERDLMLLLNKGGVCVYRTSSRARCAAISISRKPNFHMTEPRIVLGEPSESMREMIRQMLEKKG